MLNSSSSGQSVFDDNVDPVSNQVVFIDPTVVDDQSLLDDLAPGTQVYLLDPDQDGLQQIAQVMQGLSGVAAISVIAHGGEGTIKLGSTIVDQAAVSQAHAALATIGAALAPGGDILLYGCDTGEGSDGQALVDQIASATGANVAAASHVVGDVADGGSWALDVTSTGTPIVVPSVLSTNAEDSYTQPLAINDPPAGFPLSISSFTAANLASFTTSGGTVTNGKVGGTSPVAIVATTSSTSTTPGNNALKLTDATGDETATVIYNSEFAASTGISVSFQYYSGGGTGADGLSFFLIDGDRVDAAGGLSKVTPGAYGGALSYADEGTAGAGLTDGFLGIGFDAFGNFIGKDRGENTYYATGATKNTIGVRGAEYPTSSSTGSGTTAYSYLNEATYASGIDGIRNVKINLIKVDSTHEQLSVFMSTDGGNTYTEVITNEVINQTLPSNFYLGFGSSTGGSTDIHQINSLSVTLPVNLAVSQPTFTTPSTYVADNYTLTAGEAFTYSYTIANSGPNGTSQITLVDNAASVETGVTWTIKDDLGTHTGTGNINLSNINLSSGDTATVTVSGKISASAATGNASHTVTVTPGTGFSYQTPSTGIVEMAIGSPNPQLTGVASVSTTGTTAVALFPAAQVADVHSSATFTGTITLSNAAGTVTDANGKLSGTGLTETSTAGIYTLTASSAATFNSYLEALLFTPTSSNSTVTTNVKLSISDGVSGTTAAVATTTATATCFLAGTQILTDEGEVAVEALVPQQRVAVLEDGQLVFRKIVWIGSRTLDARTVAATGQYPVRITRHAFADNVPHRDLLVTSEHCIFEGGRLIPARMLVNGRSIIEDHGIGSYSYYHVELERHGVLLAEGLAAESYLDTGNRGSFSNSDVVSLRPDLTPRRWQEDACAPLATAREAVEPLWRQLDARADQLGLPARPQPAASEHDPDLCVQLDDRSLLPARWQDGARYFFQLPEGRRATQLLSRRAVPAIQLGAFVDDRRQLGVQVEALVLWQGLDVCIFPAESLVGAGWHELEDGRRWTNGAARLDLPDTRRSDSFLEVIVTGSLEYPGTRLELAA